MRLGVRTLLSLALCAATAAAVVAHVLIDVLGDYALPSDTYDNLRHGSRELVSGVALMLAMILAVHGMRICCEIATRNRTRILVPASRLLDEIGFVLGVVAAAAVFVPAMEWLDGRLDGAAVVSLGDAFGGSLWLGLGATILCASIVAVVAYRLARWLVSHRDSLATIIETLLRRISGSDVPSGFERERRLLTPRRRRTVHALRLSKRGPPEASFA